MSGSNFKEWHIAGLHALRSASEQGAQGATEMQPQVTSAEVKGLLDDYAQMAKEQQATFVGFLKHMGVEPIDFKDRIMAGIGEGTGEMLKAAKDEQLTNLSACHGSCAGLDYYVGAFNDQGAVAKHLGLTDQTDVLASMSDRALALRKRFAAAAETIRAQANG